MQGFPGNQGKVRGSRAAALNGWILAFLFLAGCNPQEDQDPWKSAEVISAAGTVDATPASMAWSGRPGVKPGLTDRRGTCRAGTRRPDRVRIGVPELLVMVNDTTGQPDPLIDLASYIKSRTGLEVEFVRLNAYPLFTSGLIDGSLQGGLFPPGEYLRARKIDPCIHLVATTMYGTSTTYTTNLVVRRDSDIMVPSDLVQKRVAFSSRSSASGYIYAVKFLADRGLIPERDYIPVFTGGHQETIRAVEIGTVAAGATFGRALNVEMQIGRDLTGLSILAVAGQIPNEPLVFASDLDPDIIRAMTDAFLSLNRGTAEGRKLLGALDLMSGWVRADDSFYDGLMTTVQAVDRIVRSADSGGEIGR